MSLQFSNTTTRKGILQSIERKLGFNPGDISDSTAKKLDFTAEINTDIDYTISLILQCGGLWQLDDTNHTDYPMISTNLLSGRRDYTFLTDGSNNLVLDIYRVMVADSSGYFREIKSVDQQTLTNNNSDTNTLIDGQNSTGTPTRYDKTANGLFLDLIPNYSYANGLKVFINREFSYFTSSDTTKMPGFAGLFHEFLPLRTSWRYAVDKSLPSAKSLGEQVQLMERDIKAYYGSRDKDTPKRMVANVENNK